MKKNSKLFIALGLLLVGVVGVSFAYFLVGVSFVGGGASNTGNTAKLINVEYDAGTSTLTGSLMPGNKLSKTFTVSVTPGSDTNKAVYAIKMNVTNNTFVKCTEANYNSVSNACTKNAEELVYTLKNSSGTVVATGDLTAKTGEVILATETKTASAKTDYNYTLEIEFKDTNTDQNHNTNKTFTGNVKVEFAE